MESEPQDTLKLANSNDKASGGKSSDNSTRQSVSKTAAEIADPDRGWRHEPNVAISQYLNLANPQFSILELMIITTISFGVLIIISKTGLGGTIGLFVVAALTFYFLRMSFGDELRYRFWNQVVWGVVMPLACIFGDQVVFGHFVNGVPNDLTSHAIACYSFIGWQMLVMSASWFVHPSSQIFNQFASGTFTAGATFCYLIAILLTPLAIMLTPFFGLGLPGFTPLITGNVYRCTAAMHRARGKITSGLRLAEVTGFLIAFSMIAAGYGVSLVFEENIRDWLGNTPPFF